MKVKKIFIDLIIIAAVFILGSCSVSSDIASDNYFEFNSETGAIIKYHPRGIDGDMKLISNLIVPDEILNVKVRSISPNAFNYEKELKSIVLSDYITSIDEFAFYGCKNLKDVTIGNQVIEVGDSAFYGCESLESVIFGSSVESIGKDAFKNASAMKSIKLPDQMKHVGEGAFWGLRNVERIELGNGLEFIEKYAFYGVGSYDGIGLVIPQSVKYIGESAFSNVRITHVYFHAEDVVLDVGDFDLTFESLVNKLLTEDNTSGYYYMNSESEWVKIPLDVVKTPIDITKILVFILGAICIFFSLYLISGKQHILIGLWELAPFALFFMIIMIGLEINPLGELVVDFSFSYPIYFIFLAGVFGMNLRNRNTYVCYNWSYNDAIHHVSEWLKNNEIEFKSEEETPGGKYVFVFSDLNRIYLLKGFGEVRIDIKEVKGLSLPKELLTEIKRHSSHKWGLKLSSSAIRYLTIGLLLIIFN